uniref:Uncharacterized protein n=1 Tax=Fagus sylvatica TaxID=28930 RepID=A0A2N9I846_FAGSY
MTGVRRYWSRYWAAETTGVRQQWSRLGCGFAASSMATVVAVVAIG